MILKTGNYFKSRGDIYLISKIVYGSEDQIIFVNINNGIAKNPLDLFGSFQQTPDNNGTIFFNDIKKIVIITESEFHIRSFEEILVNSYGLNTYKNYMKEHRENVEKYKFSESRKKYPGVLVTSSPDYSIFLSFVYKDKYGFVNMNTGRIGKLYDSLSAINYPFYIIL